MEPSTARRLLDGAQGGACGDLIFVGAPERHLSRITLTAAHELAHVLGHTLVRRQLTFLAEGFACYGAWAIGTDPRPTGLSLHTYTAWLLGVGVKPSLSDLWSRRDHCLELYDLAWSFAVFLAQRFGKERYFAFYASRETAPERRAEAILGLSLANLERAWHSEARRRVPTSPAQISRLDRQVGVLCSRAQ